MVGQTRTVVQKASKSTGLFTNYKFIGLWLAGAVSSFSLSVYLLSEEWYVLTGLHLQSMLGIVMMVTLIPRVILMVLGGAFSDRMERKKILFLSDCIRGLLVGLMAILVVLHSLNIWVLLIFAFIFGTLDAFYWPAVSSFLPFLINKDQLTRANSVIQATNQILMTAGPAFGAFLIHWISFKGVFTVTAILLAIGSLLNLSIRETAKPKNTETKASLFSDLKEAIVYVKSEPYLLTVMGMSITINFLISGPLSVGLPLLVKNVLHGSSYTLSLLEGALTFGMFAGAVVAGVVNFKRKRAIINPFLIMLSSVAVILLSLANDPLLSMACALFAGAFISMGNIIGPSLSQSYIKKAYMGRVQSLMQMTGMGLMPLSFAIVSFLLSIGLSISLLITIGSILTILFIILVLSFVRELWTID